MQKIADIQTDIVSEPRPPRLQFEEAFYHVYNRGNRREKIFWSNADYREFEDFALDLASRMAVNIYAWCLMPNHFHLLLETPLANVASYMQRLLGSYARYFNRTHRKIGHVFQGRYGAKLCDQEEYLLHLVRYIHLNPYKVKTRHFVPEQGWPWSSHRYYVNSEAPLTVRPYVHAVLRRFSEDPVKARVNYMQFIADGLAKGNWQDFYKPAGNYLGNEPFIEQAKSKSGRDIRQTGRLERIDFQQLSRVVAETFRLTPAQLLDRTQNRKVTQARNALVYLAKRYNRVSTTQLARYLEKDPSAISHMYRQVEKTGETDAIQVILVVLMGKSKVLCA